MKFIELLRAFVALAPRATHSVDIDFHKICKECNLEVRTDEARVRSLFEERAGFVPAGQSQNAEYRLAHPRLLTTLPGERMRALEARKLKYGDAVGALLPQLTAAIVKLALVDDELANERYRADQMRDAGRRREALGIYDQVVTAIDMLFNGYGATRWHWASLSDEQLRNMAAILLRMAPDDLEVLNRDAFGEVDDA
jgi:hypothetical protein